MLKHLLSRLLIAVVYGSVISLPVAHAQDSVPRLWEIKPPIIYKEESRFVRVPAQIGDVTGGVAGSAVGTVIGIPIGIVTSLKRADNIFFAPYWGHLLVGGCGRAAGAGLTGFPFFILQKAFYDLPRYILAKEKGPDHMPEQPPPGIPEHPPLQIFNPIEVPNTLKLPPGNASDEPSSARSQCITRFQE